MKQYVIDEIRPWDYDKLKAYLDERYPAGALAGVYRVFVDEKYLTPTQRAHDACRPYYCAIELAADRIACEFLVRSGKNIRCACIEYAGNGLRNVLMDLMDDMFADLSIIS